MRDLINQNIIKINDYPFERLSALLKDTRPLKKEIINLSIGQPNHKTPFFVDPIIKKHKTNWNLYPPLIGLDCLKKSYLNWIVRRFNSGRFLSSENILPLSGSREGLFTISLILNIKKLIVPNPFYQAYLGSSILGNMRITYLDLDVENNYLYDLEKLENEISKRPALIYFCSPSNPQGKCASLNYLRKLINLVRKNNSLIVIDECYTDIYYNTKPAGAVEACEGLGKSMKNVIVSHTLSKRSNAAGIRSAFITADKDIIKALKKFRSYSAPTIPIPLQYTSSALWNDDKHVAENRLEYKKKFDYADKLLSFYKHYKRPEAGFYIWLKVKNGEKTAIDLYKKYSLKVMPGSFLAKGLGNDNPGKNFVRLALVPKFVVCKEALLRVKKYLYEK